MTKKPRIRPAHFPPEPDDDLMEQVTEHSTIDAENAPAHNEMDNDALDKAAEQAEEPRPEIEGTDESVSPSAGGRYTLVDGIRIKVQD